MRSEGGNTNDGDRANALLHFQDVRNLLRRTDVCAVTRPGAESVCVRELLGLMQPDCFDPSGTAGTSKSLLIARTLGLRAISLCLVQRN